MNKTVKWVTRTAVMLALTVLFQSLRLIIPMPGTLSQYIVGSLVNLALIVAAMTIDLKGGLTVAALTPIIAFFQGHIPQIMPLMILFVALGNATIVIAYALLCRDSFVSKVLALVIGTITKFLVLYVLVVKFALPLIYPAVPDTVRMAMSINFSWPQLVTAGIGGVLALLVIPLLRRALKPIDA
jgi:riboflavin transporter FmnP